LSELSGDGAVFELMNSWNSLVLALPA